VKLNTGKVLSAFIISFYVKIRTFWMPYTRT